MNMGLGISCVSSGQVLFARMHAWELRGKRCSGTIFFSSPTMTTTFTHLHQAYTAVYTYIAEIEPDLRQAD